MSALNKHQREVLAVIADAKSGQISGQSIATWLLCRTNFDAIRETLKSLERRGLVDMKPMDDPSDEQRRKYPDRRKALYSIRR